jgi:hypothetical protein
MNKMEHMNSVKIVNLDSRKPLMENVLFQTVLNIIIMMNVVYVK